MKIAYFQIAEIKSQRAHLTQVIAMCNAFCSNGHYVTLYLPYEGNSIDESLLILNNTYGRICFTLSFVYSSISVISKRFKKYLYSRSVKQMILKDKPDLCFVRNPLLLKACIKTGVNTIYEAHNDRLHIGSSIINKAFTSIIKSAFSKPNFVLFICISKALKNYWEKQGVPKNKLLALHDGFNPTYFKNTLIKSEARKLFGLDANRFIACYTGNLMADRGIEIILKAAKKLPDILFLIVGGTKQDQRILIDLSINQEINNIKFIDKLPQVDIPKILWASDVLLGIWSSKVPTINYCSPLKIFEYMAAGRIIIAQAFPTVKEVLNNQNAILVAPDDVNSLIEGIKKATRSESSIAIKAMNEANNSYTWEFRVKKILKLISDYPSGI